MEQPRPQRRSPSNESTPRYTANIADNPMSALLYTVSSAICTPNSLSQDVKLGLGARAGEARLSEVLAEAGLSRVRRMAATPLNLILEAKP